MVVLVLYCSSGASEGAGEGACEANWGAEILQMELITYIIKAGVQKAYGFSGWGREILQMELIMAYHSQMTRSSWKSAYEGGQHVGPSETRDAGTWFAVPKALDFANCDI